MKIFFPRQSIYNVDNIGIFMISNKATIVFYKGKHSVNKTTSVYNVHILLSSVMSAHSAFTVPAFAYVRKSSKCELLDGTPPEYFGIIKSLVTKVL